MASSNGAFVERERLLREAFAALRAVPPVRREFESGYAFLLAQGIHRARLADLEAQLEAVVAEAWSA